MKTTLKLKTPKPRNPMVALALKGIAGSHRASNSALRQQAARFLRQEVERLRPSP